MVGSESALLTSFFFLAPRKVLDREDALGSDSQEHRNHGSLCFVREIIEQERTSRHTADSRRVNLELQVNNSSTSTPREVPDT